MMALVREWLLGIAGAAILTALADGLMPQGGARQVGRLVCGLVVLLAVLRPLASAELTELSDHLRYDGQAFQDRVDSLQREADNQMKTIIEERMGAYSVEKAAEMGLTCEVRVECQPDGDGLFLPVGAQVVGLELPEEQKRFRESICKDFGLAPGQIQFQEVEAP